MSVATSMMAMRPIDERFCNSVIENVTCTAAGTDQACVDACVGKYIGTDMRRYPWRVECIILHMQIHAI